MPHTSTSNIDMRPLSLSPESCTFFSNHLTRITERMEGATSQSVETLFGADKQRGKLAIKLVNNVTNDGISKSLRDCYIEGARMLSAQRIWECCDEKAITQYPTSQPYTTLGVSRHTHSRNVRREKINIPDPDSYPQINFDKLTRWLLTLNVGYSDLPLPPSWERRSVGIARAMSCLSLLVRIAFPSEKEQMSLREELQTAADPLAQIASLELVPWFRDATLWCDGDDAMAIVLLMRSTSALADLFDALAAARDADGWHYYAGRCLEAIVEQGGPDLNPPLGRSDDHTIQVIRRLLGWSYCYIMLIAGFNGDE